VLKPDFTSGGGAGKHVLAYVRFQIGGWLRARLGFYSAWSLFFVFHILGVRPYLLKHCYVPSAPFFLMLYYFNASVADSLNHPKAIVSSRVDPDPFSSE
jgi:hypothetical protein